MLMMVRVLIRWIQLIHMTHISMQISILPGVNQSIVYFSQTDMKDFVSDLKGNTWNDVWRNIKHTIFNSVNNMKDLDCTSM